MPCVKKQISHKKLKKNQLGIRFFKNVLKLKIITKYDRTSSVRIFFFLYILGLVNLPTSPFTTYRCSHGKLGHNYFEPSAESLRFFSGAYNSRAAIFAKKIVSKHTSQAAEYCPQF